MTFPSIRIEGAILSGELLEKLDKSDFVGQRPADFGFDSQAKLKEEIVRAWTAAQAFYSAFQHKLETVKEGTAATSETRNQWIIPLLGLLGYAELEFQSQSEFVGDKPFRLSHRLRSHGGFHVHIVGARESLDKKPVAGPRVSPHAHLQEYLNLTEHLYGLVTNGKLLRLLRDSTRLIKLSYVEFDLDRMFSEELFADFAVFYRLLHVTRLPRSPEKSSESLLERYHQDALESGARIRDGLSFAVEQVVQELGSGFLARNESLQAAVANNSVSARELHHALLRLIYRLLLMMVAEERGLLFTDAATPRQRKLYLDHYSIGRLRRLAERCALADATKHDLWRGLRSTFRLFETDGPGAPLGLTGLGGQLFSTAALGPLQSAELDNGTLLSALATLSLFRQPDTGQISRVNYGALATEEFGSVYERLLELHPVINPSVGNLPPTFGFKQAAGNERKTSGSYYTPSSLVECLLDSALDPVLDDRLKNFAKLGFKSADEAVLALKVCDPACGSGHFLIAAAQRIARRLALIRSKGDEPSVSELRHTLREVISHCIYGVDINPMSVELCKVALWLEAMEAGKPLSFLDHHIRCGNSLLGATPELIAKGIPDDAFTAIEGDDKKACAALKKLNSRERAGFGELFVLEDRATFEKLQQAAVAVENLPDDSVHAVEQKSAAFEQLQHNYDLQKATDLANLWCAAFVIRKRMADERPSANGESAAASLRKTDSATPSPEQSGLFGETFAAPAATQKKFAKATAVSSLAETVGITMGCLRDFAKGAAMPNGMMNEVQQLVGQYNFFHWHLSFPEVFKRDGFDVVLGNPPWEKIKLSEKEWFAERNPEITDAANATARKKLIAELKTKAPSLHAEFLNALRQADGESHMMRNSGTFPLCGRGDINLYAVFGEQMRRLLNPTGRLGAVLPTGIATDDNTKDFFREITEKRVMVSLFDFQSGGALFGDIGHARFKFCLFTVVGASLGRSEDGEFAFYLRDVAQLNESDKRFRLTAEDIQLLNPNSRTCPIFRSRRDANIARQIYRHVPVLLREGRDAQNPWRIRLSRMFDISNDSHLFAESEKLHSDGFVFDGGRFRKGPLQYLPLYEAKMMHQFEHRFGDYQHRAEDSESTALPGVQVSDLVNPLFTITPQYWLAENEIRESTAGKESKGWFLCYRRLARAADFRTIIAAVLPMCGVADKAPVIMSPEPADRIACLLGSLNSFACDYAARQKVGGTQLDYHIVYQFAVLAPTTYDQTCSWNGGAQTLKEWLLLRVLELTYTAWDLEAFAQDCGWSGPPFRWDEERRFQLRCELDAAFFHLYGLNRDDTAYILDTFPIVKRKDEEKFGTYRTKNHILALYDALAECQRTGKQFVSSLNPPPADARCCHPPKQVATPVVIERSLPKGRRVTLGDQLYAIQLVRALLSESSGSIAWARLVDAFTLATQPALMRQHTKSIDAARVTAWSKRWNESLAPGSLVTAIETLGANNLKADRYDDTWIISLRDKTPQSSAEDVIYDAWLALRVLGPVPAIPQANPTLVIAEFDDWTTRMEAQLVA